MAAYRVVEACRLRNIKANQKRNSLHIVQEKTQKWAVFNSTESLPMMCRPHCEDCKGRLDVLLQDANKLHPN